MDSNIDPSITELELFHVPGSLGNTSKEHSVIAEEDGNREDGGHVSIPNVFRLNEYVADHHNTQGNSHHEEDSSTTAAALNMIQFNNFDDSHVDVERETQANLGNEADFPQFLDDQLLDHGAESYNIQPSKASSAVKVVPYNPSERTKRLGRPRKNISNNLATPENSSSQNLNEAIVSKFRLDRMPLEGPGSRGGKLGARRNPRGRVTQGSIMKRKQQALIGSFTSVDANGNKTSKVTLETSLPENESSPVTPDVTHNKDVNSLQVSEEVDSDPVVEVSSENKDTSQEEEPEANDAQERKDPINIGVEQDTNSHTNIPLNKRSLTNSKSKTPALKKGRTSRGSRVTSTSRTSVRNNRHKATRQLPGPLVGLYYDLYDDNIIDAQQNTEASSEKVSLGFPVIRTPYANDILYIISYLNKFREVIFGERTEYLGPQDIEVGLSLPLVENDNNLHGKFNSRQATVTENYDPSYVSPTMQNLFARLLTLVLNRKKEVNPNSPSKAIAELKSMALYLGLPREWRDDSNVLVRNKIDVKQDVEPVDLKNPEILNYDNYEYESPSAKPNPFKNTPEFESSGLRGISRPTDRLILLRTLLQWSLTTSDSIKAYITQSLQNQDISGEKDTTYVPRSIQKGFKNTADVKRETELKISKRNSNKSSEVRDMPESDMVSRYIDPTSDPLSHSMRLRLDEQFAGDIGFNIGRFFLCRMADPETGGISSIKKMKYTRANVNDITASLPSQFKLYVQDVHQMLLSSLAEYGVEYDEYGEELEDTIEDDTYWYEVASNAEELSNFVDYLSKKLDLIPSTEPILIISKNSMIYKPTLNLHNYLSPMLPLLLNQEKLNSDTRSSRKKVVDYNYRVTETLAHDDEEEIVVEHGEIDRGDDDDYEEEEEDQDYLD